MYCSWLFIYPSTNTCVYLLPNSMQVSYDIRLSEFSSDCNKIQCLSNKINVEPSSIYYVNIAHTLLLSLPFHLAVPQPPRTCRSAGFSTCCSRSGRGCYVAAGRCWCDRACRRYKNCCPDIGSTCKKPGS